MAFQTYQAYLAWWDRTKYKALHIYTTGQAASQTSVQVATETEASLLQHCLKEEPD